MEKNIKARVSDHESEFKRNLQKWFEDNSAKILGTDSVECTNDFIQYMMDFPGLELQSQDFQKRKRVKNSVPDYNRCIALKCNGERCSRKQKSSDTQFCGTHLKGAPHGTITDGETQNPKKQVNLWLQEINGISRYIDDEHNIYSTEDVLGSLNPPKIIGQYEIRADGTYYMSKK